MIGQLHLENAPFILALDFSSGLAAAISQETPAPGFVALLLCTAAVLFERPPLKPAMRLSYAHTANPYPMQVGLCLLAWMQYRYTCQCSWHSILLATTAFLLPM